MLAKVDPYLRPLFDALYDMLDADRLAAPTWTRGTIEVAPLAFMRGRTLNDSFIILDEAQNTSPEQMQMFLTRLGFGSKVVVTGDVTQIDLPREQASGLIQVQDILGAHRRHRVRPVQRTRTSSGTSSSSGSSRRTSGTRRRPARSGGAEWSRSRSTTAADEAVDDDGGVDARPRASSRAKAIDDGELGLAFVGPDEIRRAEARAPRASTRRRTCSRSRSTAATPCPTACRAQLGDAVLCPQVVGDGVARRRSCTGCCTCSATTTAPRWRRSESVHRQ